MPQLQPFLKEQLLNEGSNNGGMVAAHFVVDGISNLTETLLFLPKKTALQLMAKFVNSGAKDIINPESLSLEEQKSIFMEISSLISSTYFSAVDSLFNKKGKESRW
ncbi:MAG: hypothetical protein KJ893_09745 [Candidatus Omnitrophica bacterium]|nr:hypothetical protein [Candidatus Omnitrophota bacterium]MBU4479264.1 hypothetical protein [Candidatus Omnitrophota bacterium]MCG2703060.1 hypothetical protein [Candidatus Omnitrophota bacterium]